MADAVATFASSEVFTSLPVVIDTNHPFSCGYTCRLACDAAYVLPEFRADHAVLERIYSLSGSPSGFFYADVQTKTFTILLTEHDVTSAAVPLVRLMELLVHEASHLVDQVFSNLQIQACTETRAYFLDWVVGLYMYCFDHASLVTMADPSPEDVSTEAAPQMAEGS